ncbi:MAG: PIN domain-containing protein [Thermodesulfobacteriota bacterium]
MVVMVLELAVAAGCPFILTFNIRDFTGSARFGVRALTAQTFLTLLGGIP